MDSIFLNGKIYTLEESCPLVEAVGVKDGRIIKIGSNKELKSLQCEHTKVIDLEQKTVFPGFHDSHMHLLGFGASLQKIDLTGTESIEAVIQRGKAFIQEKSLEKDRWVEGRGWNQDFFVEKRFPTRYDLDQISVEYPICVTRACGHVAVVNSKALALMGVQRDTPQIEGGSFDVDEKGEPLGIFRENALMFIYNHIPEPDIEDIEKMIVDGAKLALAQGITSIQTDDFEALPVKNFEKIIQAYQQLADKQELPVRIYEQCLLPTTEKLERFLQLGYHTGVGDDFFKIGPLKLLCDGSLGARTAYLQEPYSDDPNTCGILVYTQEELDHLVDMAHRAGMQVAIHCIGDKIMYMAFDSIEKTQRCNPRKDPRHSIIHCQITDEILLNKYKELDVIAHIQPIFIHYDLHIVEDRVGKERARTSYNWGTMVKKGVHIACGSDCPVEPLDVLPGIYTAVTRKDLNGYPPSGWMPEQRLTVQEAIYGFTMGAAYAAFQEDFKGSLTPGKAADFVVLSEDIMEIEPDRIKDIQVLMTVVDGKIGYRK
ncbi:MAG: amidohydrolase [Thermotaleaceae bacterium]